MSLSFRTMTLTTYKLDPAHYFMAPSLSWDVMLKLTKVKLQLVDDPDMYLMVESGIQDGISMITTKHTVVNNPLIEDFDASNPTNYLMYLDVNNLFGWAMSQKLPQKEFEWMTEQLHQNFDVNSITDDADHLPGHELGRQQV